MSGSARSRVDRQILICRDLVRLAETHKQSAAILTSLCLQLELCICFYIAELQQGKKDTTLRWNLDREYIRSAQNPSIPELVELADLAREDTSWLSLHLDYLGHLRQFEQSSSLRGEIFASDLETAAPPASLIATSHQRRSRVIELAGLIDALEKFQELVIRQRLSREEY